MADEPRGVIQQHEDRMANDEDYRASALTPPGGVPPEDHKNDGKELAKAREGGFSE